MTKVRHKLQCTVKMVPAPKEEREGGHYSTNFIYVSFLFNWIQGEKVEGRRGTFVEGSSVKESWEVIRP